MENFSWADAITDVAITVCDTNCDIIYMNDLSIKTFCKNNESLIGQNLRKFHNERSNQIITTILATGTPNQYTIEKAGIQKLIKQTTWSKQDGTLGGLVEFSIIISQDMPHYVR